MRRWRGCSEMFLSDPFPDLSIRVAIDGDAAVGGFYLDGWAALADLRVDVVADGALDFDGEVDGDASVDGGRDEVGGVVVWSIDGDAAVGGFGEKSFALPLFAVEDDIETAVDGGGVDFAAEVAEAEAAVGGVGGDVSIDIGDVDAAVFGMELGGEVAWDVQAEVDIPTACRRGRKRSRRRGTLGADGAVGEDLDFLEQGFGLLALDSWTTTRASRAMSWRSSPMTSMPPFLAVDGDLAVDEGQGGAAEFADFFLCAEEVRVVRVAFVSVAGEVVKDWAWRGMAGQERQEVRVRPGAKLRMGVSFGLAGKGGRDGDGYGGRWAIQRFVPGGSSAFSRERRAGLYTGAVFWRGEVGDGLCIDYGDEQGDWVGYGFGFWAGWA
jgi:hypothetical protein